MAAIALLIRFSQSVEQMPQFPGGEEALMKFIQRNIQYPNKERRPIFKAG
jgi:hypothetical protein